MSGLFASASSQAVTLGTSPNLPGTNDQLFLDAWIFLMSHKDGRVIDKADDPSTIAWQLSCGLSGGISRVKFVMDSNSLTGGTNISLNAWHHIAGGYNGTLMSVFLDGVLDGTLAETANVPNNAMPVRIGSSGADSTLRNIDAALLKIRVFNRTFDSRVVSSIYPMKARDNLCDQLFYQFKFTEEAPGVPIGAGVIVNSGNQALANGSGEGAGGDVPVWDSQDLIAA